MNEAELKAAKVVNVRDYAEEEDGTFREIPLRCSDCGEPMYYDYSERDFDSEGYHHADSIALPCSSVPDEPNSHPNYLPEWEKRAAELGVKV